MRILSMLRSLRFGKVISFSLLVLLLLLASTRRSVFAQSLGPIFAGAYSVQDTGEVPDDDSSQILFSASNSNSILIGKNTTQGDAKIVQFPVTPGAGQHSTAPGTSSTVLADAHAPDGSSPLDSSMSYGPNGILFFTGSDPFSIGEIKPGSTAPDKMVALQPLGFGGDLGGGALAFI